MTTQDYLESLQNDMQTLKTNVAEKGVAVDDNDNFTTLSAKVSQISGGGDEPTFTNMVDIQDYIASCFDKVDEVLQKQVQQREVYTNNAITLYTPNIDCKSYVILERDGGIFRVCWGQKPYLYRYTSSVCNSTISGADTSFTDKRAFEDATININLQSYNSATSYYSQNFSSVDECLQAIQSNTTTYTQTTNSYFGSIGSPNAIKYSNIPAFDVSNNTMINTNVKRVSQNETIVQI